MPEARVVSGFGFCFAIATIAGDTVPVALLLRAGCGKPCAGILGHRAPPEERFSHWAGMTQDPFCSLIRIDPRRRTRFRIARSTLGGDPDTRFVPAGTDPRRDPHEFHDSLCDTPRSARGSLLPSTRFTCGRHANNGFRLVPGVRSIRHIPTSSPLFLFVWSPPLPDNRVLPCRGAVSSPHTPCQSHGSSTMVAPGRGSLLPAWPFFSSRNGM